LVEKLVVRILTIRKYIIPALPLDLISDKFAYRPTGSTTAALASLTHTAPQKLESCTDIGWLLINSKAFDTVNHCILFGNFLSLSIPPQIQRCMFHFLHNRSKTVQSEGKQSQWLPIMHSIVQGSGIEPYLVYSTDV